MTTANRVTRLGLLSCAFVATAWHVAWPATAAAHEVGTTEVIATLDARRYVVELTLNPETLLAKLDVAAGRPRAAQLRSADYPAVLESRAGEILEAVTVRFDDRTVTTSLESVSDVTTSSPESAEESLASPRVCLRLIGAVPHGARAFRWSYDLTFATYSFVVKKAGSPEGRVEWLEGEQSSTPFEVGRVAPSLPTSGRSVLLGALVLLVGAAVTRLSLRLRKRFGN